MTIVELIDCLGKTVKDISLLPAQTEHGADYEEITITFTDGSRLILTSWDYESWASGIKVALDR